MKRTILRSAPICLERGEYARLGTGIAGRYNDINPREETWIFPGLIHGEHKNGFYAVRVLPSTDAGASSYHRLGVDPFSRSNA